MLAASCDVIALFSAFPVPQAIDCIAGELCVALHMLSPQMTVLATRIAIHRAACPATRF